MPQLIVSIPSTEAGGLAVAHLSSETGRSDLGLGEYRGPLVSMLSGLEAGLNLALLGHTFHLIEVDEGDEAGAIHRIRQWHDGEGGRPGLHGRVDAVEPNAVLRPSASMGTPFQLGGFHQQYLGLMKVSDAWNAGVKGGGITVAVVDSGADPNAPGLVDDFYDVESGSAVYPAPAVDHDGHGTAMATLIRAVAPDAFLAAVRIYDQDTVNLWHALAGTGVAVYDCGADIVSISLGYRQMPADCMVCGASAQSRSLAFQYLLDGIAKAPGKKGYAPLYVAATGNDSAISGFNYPAAYDSAVAVGAVTSQLTRSSFSNYGKKSPKYFFMSPGGEENPPKVVTEAAGTGGGVQCRGTSVATAYAAGMLSLLWSDARYQGNAPDVFLGEVAKHHTVALPQQQPDANQYGSGMIRYAAAAPPFSVETNEAVTVAKRIELLRRIKYDSRGNLFIAGVRVPVKPREGS